MWKHHRYQFRNDLHRSALSSFKLKVNLVRSSAIHCAFGTCDKSHDYEFTLKFKMDRTVGWVERTGAKRSHLKKRCLNYTPTIAEMPSETQHATKDVGHTESLKSAKSDKSARIRDSDNTDITTLQEEHVHRLLKFDAYGAGYGNTNCQYQ